MNQLARLDSKEIKKNLLEKIQIMILEDNHLIWRYL